MITYRGRRYILTSRATGRHLGTFTSLDAAKARERQINFFKHRRAMQ